MIEAITRGSASRRLTKVAEITFAVGSLAAGKGASLAGMQILEAVGGEPSTVTGLQTLLRRAEHDAETTSAIVRLAVFLSLALTIFAVMGVRGAVMGAAPYGLVTAIGLFLAWRRIFHPAIPFLFVTFDIILVVAQVRMLAHAMGMPPDSIFRLPATALVFVFLIHAAMRFRPSLVAYAATLFVILVELLPFLPAVLSPRMEEMHAIAQANLVGLLNYQALPLTVIALAAFILFINVRRTRELLLSSISHAARTARLSRYFSPNLAARLADDDSDQLLAGRRQPAAVLFVDIRDFTALGEAMAPDALSAFLAEYRHRLVQPVFSHGGTVDKFIGDAIMAVFGSPIQRSDDASRAVHSAMEILEAAALWSFERKRSGLPPVAIGIGAHYGEVFAGAVGCEHLREFTVIGDTVNVAQRLERLSREVDSPLVVSAALLQAAGAENTTKWRRLPPQQLKGHSEPVEVLCLA
jgi:adenylate cyclase